MGLNKAQEAAVRHFEGPALVLAGPGSGKTTVITNRIRHLTKEHRIRPDKILVLTFTKAAASQMQSRYLELVGESASKVTFGTFHSVFFMILRDVYGYCGQDIIKPQEQEDFIRIQMKAKGMCFRDEQRVIADILSEIAKVKAQGIVVEGYEAASCERELFAAFFKEYDRMLSLERRVDFEDMMIKTYRLLKGRQDVFKRWQERYDFFMIDEFQDSSFMQFEILRLLAGQRSNLFAVGDDDQSIYGFRGADFRVMQRFCDCYRDASVYHLDVNYRSAKQVVQAAAHIISSNSARFPKQIRAAGSFAGMIELVCFKDIEEENRYVIQQISGCIRRKEEAAVLTRTNFEAEGIIRALQGDLKFLTGTQEDICGHWIMEDVTAYMRIACGCAGQGDYIRIINKPMRDISRDFFAKSRIDTAEIIRNMERIGQTVLAGTFQRFCSDMTVIGNLPPFAGLTYLRKAVGYERYLKDYAKVQHTDEKAWLGILDSIGESMKDCKSYAQWFEKVSGIREKKQAGKGKNSIWEKQMQNDLISFCTIHRAKGLEFDTVLILDANDRIMPYEKAFTKEALEEERRLFYVALTRARKKIIVCFTKERYHKKVQPSPYVKELHTHMKIPYSCGSSSSSS